MIEGSLSRRYSKALFEMALEASREDVLGQEFERFVASYNGSPLREVLNNPAFELGSRKQVLLRVSKELELSTLAENFLGLLLERDRMSFLPSIVASYFRLLNEHKGRVEAKVRVAAPLEPRQREQLRSSLSGVSGKEVILHEQNDPELIGGVVVELAGRIYDGSVRTQLERMKQKIARGL